MPAAASDRSSTGIMTSAFHRKKTSARRSRKFERGKRCPQMSTTSNDLAHDNFTTFSAVSPPGPTSEKLSMTVQKVAEASTLQTSGTEARDAVQAAAAPGFRHFLRTPLPSQRFRAYGIDPLQSPAL